MLFGAGSTLAETTIPEPWLEVLTKSRTVEVYRGGEVADAALRLTLVNRLSQRVRVDAASVTFLAETGAPISERALAPPDPLEAGGSVEWNGVCLVPPEDARRIRLALRLSARRGSRVTSSQSIDLDLRATPPSRPLHFPFEGYWRVTQGHACGTNHRLGGLGGDYAWDFVAIDRAGKASVPPQDAARHNRDSATFGQSVRAPADGRVLRTVNDVPDNEGLNEFPRRSLLEGLQKPDWIFGNYVVVDLGDDVYLLLAHLEHGSIAVAVGQTVREGEPLARCGNSGNTMISHLHLQLMDRPDPSDAAVRGIPAKLVSYTEITSPKGGTSRDVFIRRVAASDPPEGSVIAPFYPDTPER